MPDDASYASVVILGAGLSGIGCARHLPGSRVFEAKSHVGGHAASHAWQGFHFDEGAHICHTRDEDFLKLLGAFDRTDIVSVHNRTANWDRGRWLSYPVQNHLHELPIDERIKALTGFVRAQTERREEAADYHAWCLSQYGEYLTETYYRRYTEKYWRMAMAEMDTDWMTGRLLPAQVDRVVAGAIAAQSEMQPVFSHFRYPREGGFMALMKPLFHGIEVSLNESAVTIDHRKKTVSFASGRIEPYEDLVSTIPLPKLLAMMNDLPPGVRDAARKLRWTQLICVNFVVARPRVVPWHWFYIYDSDIQAARVSVPSNLTDDSGNVSAFQAEVFRRDDEPVELERLGEEVVTELQPLLNVTRAEITAAHAMLVPFGYVIPCLGHAAAAAHINEWLKSQRIETAGLFGRWKYVWSDAAYRSGEAAAGALRALRSHATR